MAGEAQLRLPRDSGGSQAWGRKTHEQTKLATTNPPSGGTPRRSEQGLRDLDALGVAA